MAFIPADHRAGLQRRPLRRREHQAAVLPRICGTQPFRRLAMVTLLLRPEEVGRLLGIGRTKVFAMIWAGQVSALFDYLVDLH